MSEDYTKEEELCAKAITQWLMENNVYKGGTIMGVPAWNTVRVDGSFKMGDLASAVVAAMKIKA